MEEQKPNDNLDSIISWLRSAKAPEQVAASTSVVNPRDVPQAISFSTVESDEYDEHFEPTALDPAVEDGLQADSFLFILKSLPKDRYRVIALLLFLKNEMGYDYTYEDIGAIWGHSKVNVFNTIQRMQKVLVKAKLIE